MEITGHCLTGLHTQLDRGSSSSAERAVSESPFMDAWYVDGDGRA